MQWYQGVSWLRGLDLNQRPSGYEAVSLGYNSLIPLFFSMLSIVYSKPLHFLLAKSETYGSLTNTRNLHNRGSADEL